ncbi:dethiobiotin synthase [Streptomyces sp. NPDC046977]|uniref:dethiobiotin synthase n=1 Tax=Streptomyces sp. NPDC046977 TaxID=3154703 RepID=UPI0033DAD1AC
MTVLFVTGTGTEIGKTVVTAAVAATALAVGASVAYLKPAQTGLRPDEPGDAAEVTRLAGYELTGVELARYPDPLAPATAARRAGRPAVGPGEIAEAAAKLAAVHDIVLVEGAGGLLVRFDEEGSTLADAAKMLGSPVLVVAPAGLGTLNTAALTAEALRARALTCAGFVIGSWPDDPDLAARSNLADLPVCTGAPLVGAVPAGAAQLTPEAFQRAAPGWIAPRIGGLWDVDAFTAVWSSII